MRRQKTRLALLDYFATAVSKNGEPCVGRHGHLTWYRGIQAPEPVRAVTLENTFGKLKIRPRPELSRDRAKRAAGRA